MAEKELTRKGVIDLGTNTFNLLIGEINDQRLKVIFSEKSPVLLGMGGINSGCIAEDAMSRAKKTLVFFKEKCQDYGVSQVIATGTSAMRSANNADELVNFAKNELDIEVKIVSGLEEADLIYKGVRWCHTFDDSTLIMDIGGGSTEFVHASANRVINATSLDIGVSRIFQLLNKPSELSKTDVKTVQSFLKKNQTTFFDEVNSTSVVGSSGSFETLFEMVNQCSFPNSDVTMELPMDKVMETLDWIISSSLEERMKNEWISTMRKTMMPISALKMKWIFELNKTERLHVSPYSLKEGVFSLT